ncbi:hypothetical protein ACFYNF_34470 [Streptomyces sp. NPDC006641]|uniref:hypothetical protein n=1 Tax=unclassified Streptomyces TaxID=2593676 RepID=UPI0036CD9C94
MDLNREPQTIAHAAADEIRAANHLALDVKSFYGENGRIGAAPSNVSSTVDGLATLLERLPQTLEQTSRALQHLEEQQAIRMANGGDPSEEVSVVLRALLNAQQAIVVAHGHMREAAGPLSNMGGHFLDDDELEDADTAV